MSAPAVRLDPMTGAEYDGWAGHSVAGYAAELADSGAVPAGESSAYAAEQLAALLPHGPDTPGHHLWTVRDAAGREVGVLWMHIRDRGSLHEAFVYDVEVTEQVRGRGFGRATMLAALGRARELGAGRVQLNVFAHNLAATRLYESLGFRVSMTALSRPVPGASPAGNGGAHPRLRALTTDELASLRPRWVSERAGEIEAAGLAPAAEARARATDEHAVLLRDGVRTEGALLWTPLETGAADEDAAWLQVAQRPGELRAVAHRLPDRDDLVAAVVGECARRHVGSVEVSAFGPAAAARREAQGFVPSARLMLRDL